MGAPALAACGHHLDGRPTRLAANDSLIVLDEAHCSVPFLQTFRAIQKYRGTAWAESPLATPFAFVVLSATPPRDIPEDAIFPGAEREQALDHPELRKRLQASKPAELIRAHIPMISSLTKLVAKGESKTLEFKRSTAIVLTVADISDSVPFTYEGGAFDRVDNTTRKMTPERYEALLLEPAHSRRRWENQEADELTIKDIDREDAQRTPTVADFALHGPVLPLFTEAVLVAEQFRSAAMSRHGTPSRTLAGKSSDGGRARGQHDHAHYVPDSRGRTNGVTHVLVYAPRGFSETELAALARVSFLAQRRDRPTLDVALSGFGDCDHFTRVTPLFGSSTRWRSQSPFVLVRYPRRGKDGAVDQVIRELTVRGLPVPEQVIPISGVRLTDAHAGGAGVTRWGEFEVTRPDRSHPPGAFGFDLVFREPVRGPILLGYGCHYGLGQFAAME